MHLMRGLKVAELEFLDCGTYLHTKSAAIAESGNIDGNKSKDSQLVEMRYYAWQ